MLRYHPGERLLEVEEACFNVGLGRLKNRPREGVLVVPGS
jgi:hypothetical protein